MTVRKLIATVFAVMALVAGSVLGLTGAASAAPAQSDGHSAFSAQTQKAGLTGAQARQLQTKVDGYVAKTGGTQVSANKIAVEGGDLLVAAPGQRYARDLAGPAGDSAVAACGYGWLCLYRGGDTLNYYRCGTYSMPWVGDGSFINNQTTGTVARFLNSDRSERWSSRAYQSGTATWTPVYYVVPC